MKLLQKTDSLKTGYLGTRLSGFMGKYTIKKTMASAAKTFTNNGGSRRCDLGEP